MYLSSNRLRIHTNTLVNLTQSLVLSKIDYGLQIYGWCAKSHLALLNKPYHTSVRCSIKGFSTSPTKCVLAEAGLPSIIDRCQETTYKLIPKLMNTTSKLLFDTLRSASRNKRRHSIVSTLRHCIAYCKDLGIKIPSSCKKVSRHAPWILSPSSLNIQLHNFPKSTTCKTTFTQLFNQIINIEDLFDWCPIFTDGSKSEHNTAFAVVKENGDLIYGGSLPLYASIYTAEAVAILKAIDYAVIKKGKFAIFSDSFSVIESIKNIYNDNQIASQIRDQLIKHADKIKIVWIPSHVGIKGNEHADLAAKNMYLTPTISFDSPSRKDLVKYIQSHIYTLKLNSWSQFNHPYMQYNPQCKKSLFPPSVSRLLTSVFTRLRIGHTKLTHQHLLLGDPSPVCPLCGDHLNVTHILDSCSPLSSKRTSNFGTTLPSSLLKDINVSNITTLFNFLKEIDLHKSL
ncbi:PREDICTED: uncharacterized protein LOC108363750 isoform X2 [Rhagoletis zephyria]|uniref:uncharacterized protein LOC108363750 isoform X2 n=1 Tax=Rhagoletis zephyria TaxID=28612 RepID=UPI00081155D0|nr:PREDICTED: uncharacterized protein LOC108363750 isoform X2 [Rhagoletis zephyria]